MAQAPEAFPWWDRPIAQNLNLSPEQQKQIQATVREFRDRLIELETTPAPQPKPGRRFLDYFFLSYDGFFVLFLFFSR